MYQGKRLQFRCNRWLRVGQLIRSIDGGQATIQRIDDNGIKYGGGSGLSAWACTRPWNCVWKTHGVALAFTKAWRPA